MFSVVVTGVVAICLVVDVVIDVAIVVLGVVLVVVVVIVVPCSLLIVPPPCPMFLVSGRLCRDVDIKTSSNRVSVKSAANGGPQI